MRKYHKSFKFVVGCCTAGTGECENQLSDIMENGWLVAVWGWITLKRHHTEMANKYGTWLRKVSSCCCLTTAGKTRQLLLNKIYIPFLPSLYKRTSLTKRVERGNVVVVGRRRGGLPVRAGRRRRVRITASTHLRSGNFKQESKVLNDNIVGLL